MICREIQDSLSAYIDQELAPEAMESARLHLAACEQCTARYARLLAGWQALDAWEDVMPPDRLQRKILDSAGLQGNTPLRRAVVAVAAALVLVLGVLAYYAGQSNRSKQDLARSQSPYQAAVGGAVSEDEIIANLLILQENDFFEALDELVKIDDLPLAEEQSGSRKEPERSSLEMVFT